MAITIKDILKLKSMRSFEIITGKASIDNIVKLVDMLDFGWEAKKTYCEDLFDKHSFVISSFIFAKDDKTKLYTTIQRLIECGVSGLAYKPVFYKDLPQDICRLADENDFPIFRFSNEITFREIICDITDAVRLNEKILEITGYIYLMMFQNLSRKEVSQFAAMISSSFQKNAKAVIISNFKEKDSFYFDCIIRNFQSYYLEENIALCRFEWGLVLIITLEGKEINKFNAILDHVLSISQIRRSSVCLAHSRIHPTYTELDRCVKEAYCAYVAGMVLNRQDTKYDEIGMLSFLIPLYNNSYIQEHMHNFLLPILIDNEMIKTAIAFVQAGGNYAEAAKSLNFHKNTVRYRINKIKAILAPELNYEEFYNELSVSVKVYLIKKAQRFLV